MRHLCRPAFTLVELMAVVGIMALLAVVGMPALKGLTGSGGRKAALGQVMGALELARNTAISSSTNTAVIFPDISHVQTLGEAFPYRTMAVVRWNVTNSTSPPTMVGSWISLPQGVSFFPASLSATNTVRITNVTVRILTSNSMGNSFQGIVFQPDGSLLETNVLPTNGVAFFEGTVRGSSPVKTYPSNTIYETIRLARYTGRTIPVMTNEPQ